MSEDLIHRLRKRAEIRRQISTRKSVQEGKPDRIADLLEEAANEIANLREQCKTAWRCEESTATERDAAREELAYQKKRADDNLCCVAKIQEELNELKALVQVHNMGWCEDDQTIPEDEAIKAAHPVRTGEHELYAEAVRMVSAKRSKYALVDLVNYLLWLNQEYADALMQVIVDINSPHPRMGTEAGFRDAMDCCADAVDAFLKKHGR